MARTAYYQTFCGLNRLLDPFVKCDYTTIIVGALHFGYETQENSDGTSRKMPYIHLNDHAPDDPQFDQVWKDLRQLKKKQHDNFRILVMVGGAAGQDFQNLFADFGTFYPLLLQFLSRHWFITGVDIDVEETVATTDVAMLIRTLRQDFGVQKAIGDPTAVPAGRFCITMAPVAEALTDSDPYGLDYKTLDPLVDWYHVQCYGEFKPWLPYFPRSLVQRKGGVKFVCDGKTRPGDGYRKLATDVVQRMVDNGYSASRLVLGMLGRTSPDPDFEEHVVPELRSIQEQHANLLGFFVWEYFMAPPDPSDPPQWSRAIKDQVQKRRSAEGPRLGRCTVM